jgi:hypothetical protein
MMTRTLFSIIALVAWSTTQADAIYPTRPPVRYMGQNQGQVGSCETEAEIGALENTFARLGHDVRLSTWYRHVKIWQQNKPEDRKSGITLGLDENYTAADTNLLNHTGALIPDYMWPEDGGGFDLWSVAVARPRVSEQAVIDPAFPTAESLGFSEAYFNFNPAQIPAMRAAVAEGAAVVLDLPYGILRDNLFDEVTGILIKPYSTAEYASALDSEIHAVAVVGFDDDLQAWIIRNSWNSPDIVMQTSQNTYTSSQLQNLLKMRLKFSARNLPGYYALPYQFVVDMAAKNLGAWRKFNLNYGAYASAYYQFAGKYRVVLAPYSCDADQVHDTLQAYKDGVAQVQAASDERQKRYFRGQLESLYFAEATRSTGYTFSYAKLVVNDSMGVDRVAQFYDGAFDSYYCGVSRHHTERRQRWPKAGFNAVRVRNPRLENAIKTISTTPGALGWSRWFQSLLDVKLSGVEL